MRPAGELTFSAAVKEDLIAELQAQQAAHGIQITHARVEAIQQKRQRLQLQLADGSQTTAQRVIVAIGRTGNFRKLNVPGENLDKVSNRLIDATEYAGQAVLVVGGGDSALEAAIALSEAGAQVCLSYRKQQFTRAKPENVAQIKIWLPSRRSTCAWAASTEHRSANGDLVRCGSNRQPATQRCRADLNWPRAPTGFLSQIEASNCG